MSAVTESYEAYLRDEWLLFASDLVRQQEALDAAAGIEVRKVLDVGCGGGQDMIPFAATGITCIGIDISHESGVFGRALFSARYPDLAVHFATSTAEHLPFASGAFDVVLCRVAIPYTENRAALSEIARVTRPGGILLLKTHHFWYYVDKAKKAVRQRSLLSLLHAIRVMTTGAIYHLTGSQPRGGLLLRETFLTKWLLQKELQRSGMTIEGELPDTNAITPSYRIRKAV
jgi:ubiquinone/menaquinone biosynthesis C-methylase UbiE